MSLPAFAVAHCNIGGHPGITCQAAAALAAAWRLEAIIDEATRLVVGYSR